MPTTFTLIDLAGSIALLLLGTQMAQMGMHRAFGAGLQPFLLRSRDRGQAFFTGMGVTAILQSRRPTCAMTSGLSEGRAGLVHALAVMLGANIGVTLVVQVLLFDAAAVSPALILIGVLMFRRTSNTRAHDLGRAFIGLGLMLFALHELRDLMTDYEDAPSLRMMLGAATTVPLLNVLLAASLTWAADSNVAPVLLIAALGARNVVPPDTAFALVLGANLGTAIKPVLDGTVPDDPISKRVPVGNMLIVMAGMAVALAAHGPIGRFMVVMEPDNGRAVADFHTLFNVVLAIIFLPLLVPYGSILCRLMPALINVGDPFGSFRGNQPHMPIEEDPRHYAMRSGMRVRADAGDLLLGAGPRLREPMQISRRDGHQRNDVAANDDSSGPSVAPRNAMRQGVNPRSADDPPPRPVMRGAAEARRAGPMRDERGIDSENRLGRPYEAVASIWLTLENLRIVRQAEPVEGERKSMLATYIHGTAQLDDGYLCLMGEPWTQRHTVSVTFMRGDIKDEDYRGLREWQDALGIAFSDVPIGTARLGYNAADDVMQEPGRWWATLQVPASSMHGLMEGIDAAQLTNVRVALALKELYSVPAPDVAETRSDACVFLRSGSIEASALPEVTTGYVTHMTFDLASIKLCPPDEGRARDEHALRDTGIRASAVAPACEERPDSLAVRVVARIAVLAFSLFAFKEH